MWTYDYIKGLLNNANTQNNANTFEEEQLARPIRFKKNLCVYFSFPSGVHFISDKNSQRDRSQKEFVSIVWFYFLKLILILIVLKY